MSLSLTRRRALAAGSATGVAFLLPSLRLPAADTDVAEAASGSCVMTPQKTEGPYFVDETLNRSDVTEGQAGVPLTLKLQVFDAGRDCAPVSGATVDIWHANAYGKYSDVAQNQTTGQTWLRGYQVTDANGLATFQTIWPGWYQGRAVHIHFKVRTGGLEFTSQLFFTDAMNSQVFANNAPYDSRGTPDTTDTRDGIYGSDGSSLLLAPTASGAGYAADFSVGISGGGTASTGSTPSTGTTTGSTGTTTGTGTTTTTTADTSVGVALKDVAMTRTPAGTRRVRIRLKATEPVAVTARLTRGGKTRAARATTLAAGTATVRVTIPDKVPAGGAKLRLSVMDAAGNVKRYTRTVHVRRRR